MAHVFSPPSGTTASAAVSRAETEILDASTRSPVLLLVVFGGLWLLGSSALALIASIQLHNPNFLSGFAVLTHGRVQPAATNAFVYGWACNAAFALALWLMTRLSMSVVRAPALAVVGGLFWNVGVAIGVVGILIGDSTGFEGLELPRYVAPVLFVAYALIGASIVSVFRFKRSSNVYVSQWYLLAALFWFPWIYSIAQVSLLYTPVRGTMQIIVAAWYSSNVFGLWLAPVALAVVYYFLPKLLGRPINDYGHARMGFWAFALFASCAGARHLIGGPFPVWVQSAGTAAALMLLVPIVIISTNFLGTLAGGRSRGPAAPSVGFITVASVAFAIAGLLVVVTSLRGVAVTTQFTYVTRAISQLELYGFFSMAAFAAIYFILPRLLQTAWPSAALITAHFWCATVGLVLLSVSLLIGGWLQGQALNDVERYPEFVDVARRTAPFLIAQSLALVLLAVSHLAFLVNLVKLFFQPRAAATSSRVVFRAPPALEVAS